MFSKRKTPYHNKRKEQANKAMTVAAATAVLTTGAVTGIGFDVDKAEASFSSSSGATNVSQSRTQTLTIKAPGITANPKATVNTGNVRIISTDLKNETVTVEVSGGAAHGTVQTGGTYIPSDTKYVSGEGSSYYNSGGYSGSLRRYVASGQLIPSETKHVTGQSASNYNQGGFMGTLDKYVHSGTLIPAQSKEVTAQDSASYNSDGYKGTLTKYEHSSTTIPADTKSITETIYYDDIITWRKIQGGSIIHARAGGRTHGATYHYSRDGYTGELAIQDYGSSRHFLNSDGGEKYFGKDAVNGDLITKTFPNNTYAKYGGTVTRPEQKVPVYKYKGTVTKPEQDTRQYKYQGNVTKPEQDTRVYKYQGNVTKPAQDTRTYANTYKYNVTLNYEVNQAPTISNLTVPTTQFEHGDKHTIAWGATDREGDAIDYTVQAAYNGSNTWETIYTGKNKSLQYTVPSNKTSVKFRVKASDGELTSTKDSELKTIREVTYQWNKYDNKHTAAKQVLENIGTAPNGEYAKFGHSERVETGASVQEHWLDLSKGKLEVDPVTGKNHYVYPVNVTTYNKTTVAASDTRGAFVSSSEAGLNAHTHGVRNADGFWYVRGQRVLDTDATPPVIEVTEGTTKAVTSKVTVKTIDLGTVSQVKWAKGKQSTSYFASNGTVLAGTQSTNGATFNADANGFYTIYAKDNKNNEVIQEFEVTNVNTPPLMTGLKAENIFDVVDTASKITVGGTAFDVDAQNLNATVTYNGTTATAQVTDGTFKTSLLGSTFNKGVTVAPITAVVSDGLATSSSMALNNHIVIKVDNAKDYKDDLDGHSPNPELFTLAQHQAFNKAYEAVLTYEKGRTQAQYTAVNEAVTDMKQATGVATSATISEWQERVDVVYATVALEKAEGNLNKADYLTAVALRDALTLESNKNLLNARITELGKYHKASDFMLPMTALIGNKEEFFKQVNWVRINEGRDLIKLVTNSTYKADLDPRMQAIVDYYINNKDELTKDDILEGGYEIPPEGIDEDILNDIKDAFDPLTDNMDELIKVSNALKRVMEELDQAAVANYKEVVAEALKTGNGIDASKLATITGAIDSLHTHRVNFVENDAKVAETTTTIEGLTTGKKYVKLYFNKMNQAIKEVTEYNTIDFDEEHNSIENNEGVLAVDVLWDKTGFQLDMVDYLENGIPDIVLSNDKYEYIHTGTLNIKGLVNDTNHQSIDVGAVIGGVTGNETITSGGNFNIGLTLPSGITRTDVKLTANDSLTDKRITVKNKPIVHVKDSDMYTKMVKALEVDRGEDFTAMTDTVLNDLIAIQESTLDIENDSTPATVRKVYEAAEVLSTQDEGALETLVKSYVQQTYLKWIYENHTVVTVDDFELAEVMHDGKFIVTSENIEPIREVVTDYKAEFGQGAKIPGVSDYKEWADMVAEYGNLDKAILEVYNQEEPTTLLEEIATVTQMVADTIPTWLTINNKYQTDLQDLNEYHAALVGVIKLEETHLRTDLDIAQALVDKVDNVDANKKLQDRLVIMQVKVDDLEDATSVVEKAESDTMNNGVALEDAKKSAQEADDLVAALVESTPKNALLDRMLEVHDKINVREEVEKLEAQMPNVTADDIQVAQDLLGLVNDTAPAFNQDMQIRIDLLSYEIEINQAWNDIFNNHKTTQVPLNEIKDNLNDLHTTVPNEYAKVLILIEKVEKLQKMNETVRQVEQSEQDVLDKSQDYAQNTVDNAKNRVQTHEQDNVSGGVTDEDVLIEDLKNRLDEVQDKLNAQSKVKEAQDLVLDITLDVDDMQSTIDTAQGEVDKVGVATDGSELRQTETEKAFKQDLQNKLDEVQDKLDAREATEKAEETITREDWSTAKDKLTEVDKGKYKDDLYDRLLEVEDKLNAKEALEDLKDKVGNTDTEELEKDIDNTQDLIDKVEDGDFKDNLQDELDKIKEDLKEYAEQESLAEEAVQRAEDKVKEKPLDKQAVLDLVDIAQKLVDELKDGTDFKDHLNARLDAIREYINDYEKFQQAAIAAVEKAERTLNLNDYKVARTYVNLLEEGVLKEELSERLDAVYILINAIQAVERAEHLKTWDSYYEAVGVVDGIVSGSTKTYLEERLDALYKYLTARDAVDKAEDTGKQEDKDEAQDKVDDLPDGKDKEDLEDRLDDLQDQIDKDNAEQEAERLVEIAEKERTQETIDTAQEAVDNLHEGAKKDELQDRLDKLRESIQDEKDKEQAEKDKEKEKEEKEKEDELIKEIEKDLEDLEKEYDKDKAEDIQDKIDQLPDSEKKDELQDKLDEIIKGNEDSKKEDDLIKEIEKDLEDLEKEYSDEKADNIQDKIDKLPDGEDKDRLQDELDRIKENEKWKDLIDEIEKDLGKDDLTKEDLEDIQDKIDKLPDGEDKDRLQDELDKKKDELDKENDELNNGKTEEEKEKDKEKEAEKAVEKAEDTKDIDDFYDAQDKVEDLKDGPKKDELQDRLDNLKDEIAKELEDEATKAVEKAEKEKTQSAIDDARNKVNRLPAGKVKDDLNYRLDQIQDELNKSDNLEEAERLVEIAEEERTRESVEDAYEVVDKLKPSKDYDRLSERLDAVLKEIEMYEKYLELLDSNNVTKGNLEDLDYKIRSSKEVQEVDKAIDVLRGKDGVTGKEVKDVVDKKKAELDALQKLVDEIVDLAMVNQVSKEKMTKFGVTDLQELDLSLFVGLIQKHVSEHGKNSIDSDTLWAIIERVKLANGQSQDNKDISFTDTDGHWSKDNIDRLVSLGLIDGGGLFSPNADITRAQYAVILARTLNLERLNENPFGDIAGEWYEDYIVALYEKGLTTGVTSEEYAPNASVTREQSMAMLGRLVDAEGVYLDDVTELREMFEDASTVSEYAVEHIETLVAIDAVGGENNKIQPRQNLTRAQMAKIVSKTVEFVNNGGTM